jgi:protein-tyrosine phosphatase
MNTAKNKPPLHILLVCMSNVCRSPTAEVVLRKMLRDAHLGSRVEVASAGTHGFRVGSASDPQIQQVAGARGYDLSPLRARKIGWQDFDYFDLILAMDHSNLNNLRRMATEAQQGKIKLLMHYARHHTEKEIPDPYTTLGQRFDQVLDMIEDACAGLVRVLKAPPEV